MRSKLGLVTTFNVVMWNERTEFVHVEKGIGTREACESRVAREL